MHMAEQSRNMKVAIVTDDGTTISSHFGRAQFYEVLTIANGVVQHQERREKRFHGGPHGDHQSAHDDRGHHDLMVEPIRDCQIVIARGMGSGAYEHLRGANLSPILTATRTIDEAVREIIDGTMVNHIERVHQH
jgi:predicted Fe-Mo cluster-binding NifX family protein